MRCFVISLARSTDRRQRVTSNFSKLGFEFSFFDGIDAKNYSSTEIDEFVFPEHRAWKNYLRPGLVCCTLSHLAVYRECLSQGLEYAAIFEDDAVPLEKAEFVFDVFSDLITSDCDVLVLGSYTSKRSYLFLHNDIGNTRYSLYRSAKGIRAPAGAIGYVITRHAMEKILKYNFPVKYGPDSWSIFQDRLGLKIIFCKPDLTIPDFSQSVIDYVDHDRNWVSKLIPTKMKKARKKLIYRFDQQKIIRSQNQENCRSL